MNKETTTERLRKELRELKESFDLAILKPFDEHGRKYEKYIAFVLGDEIFAWPVSNLKEVVVNRRIISVPGGVDPLRGVINYKNQVLPVTSLHHMLGLPSHETGRENIMMVAGGLSFETAFPVDRLTAVLSIAKEDIKPKPLSLDHDTAAIITGELIQNDRIITILDPGSI